MQNYYIADSESEFEEIKVHDLEAILNEKYNKDDMLFKDIIGGKVRKRRKRDWRRRSVGRDRPTLPLKDGQTLRIWPRTLSPKP